MNNYNRIYVFVHCLTSDSSLHMGHPCIYIYFLIFLFYFAYVGSRRKNKRKGSGLFRSSSRSNLRNSSLNINSAGDEEIRLKDVYGAKVKYKPSPNQSCTSEGICVGITVYTVVKKDANKLKSCPVSLDHPSESLSRQWVSRIVSALKGKAHGLL